MSVSSLEGMRDLTFDAFVELPEELHQGAELFDGVVHVSSPIHRHQNAALNIAVALRAWAKEEPGRGAVIHDYLVRVDERSGYKPDVAWYPRGAIPGDEVGEWHGVPAIAVEILSPSTKRVDQVRKPRGYAAIGVAEVWLIDLDDGSALILREPAGVGYVKAVAVGPGDTITTELLPGFRLTIADVLAPG